MMAELWLTMRAARRRPHAMRLGISNLASFIWLFVGYGPDAWRYMFLIGILPHC